MIFPTKNKKVCSSVLGFISSRRIPHAILIEGESADTNSALASYIAAAAVCEGENAPCDGCNNCHLAAVGSHPDITFVTTLDGKKTLTVDQIRELRADAFVKPHSAPRRVFIISEAHRMNPQAQNALLKVLEEPPQNVVFILLVPSKTIMLDTIISRCVVLSLLECEYFDDTMLNASQEFLSLLTSGSEYNMLKLLSQFEKSRADMEEFLKTLSQWITECLKNDTLHAKVFDKIFDDIKYYLDLLATNINLSLLTSLIVSRSKGLFDN